MLKILLLQCLPGCPISHMQLVGVQEPAGPAAGAGRPAARPTAWLTAKSDLKGPTCRKRNLEPGTVYQFRIRTQVGSQWSPYSNIVTVTLASLEHFLSKISEMCFAAARNNLRPLDISHPWSLSVRRDECLEDTVESLFPLQKWLFPIYVSFEGEEGADYGALHREWVVRHCI